ncbi:plasmid mobilization protein [Bacteroides sp. 224]|uniref:plasmid mobilization protein n=1 Tax=Bacteroides sp. 224 TaxID=2302936 RepID=UPI0013D22FAE|nr:plasmid mobilization relaxosome protein MobC [Bacteroides sp. 224]NDV66918.1 plasmid mobilization relaxosome protein MobC [Bacteroides sp. 224]
METRNIGRPSKKAHEKRKYQVNVRLMTTEYYALKGKAKEASLPQTDYIRECILNSNVLQRMNPEMSDLVRKLSGMANNLNQIAKKANQAGYCEIRSEYLYLADSIDNLISKIKDDR